MTYQVCYWDDKTQSQQVRDATPDEAAEIDARKTAPSPVPEIISPRQFRQSLSHFAFRTNVENTISQSDQDTKDWYQFATQFERHHPKVIAMAQAMGYTDAQIDDVWTYGASI